MRNWLKEFEENDYVEVKGLHIYNQRDSYSIAIYFNDCNVWKEDVRPPVIFQYKDNAIKKLKEFVEGYNEKV